MFKVIVKFKSALFNRIPYWESDYKYHRISMGSTYCGWGLVLVYLWFHKDSALKYMVCIYSRKLTYSYKLQTNILNVP